MTILITGAAGFIGRALFRWLSCNWKVIGTDIAEKPIGCQGGFWEKTDLTETHKIRAICEKHSPDVVIHCAGIAHQKAGSVGLMTYLEENSYATEIVAKASSLSNANVHFIFLSTVSVYGETAQARPKLGCGLRKPFAREKLAESTACVSEIDENASYHPTSDYAVSKVDAEKRLIALFDAGVLCRLTILRLAPVYDRKWSLNLDRRIFSPKKAAYLRFGSGTQRMSALARPNLTDFIAFLLTKDQRRLLSYPQGHYFLFNVCDLESYEFNKIISVFRKSDIRSMRPIFGVPLFPVWIATRLAGSIFRGKSTWFYSCYDKLSSHLVFSNKRMLGTGFRPKHSLETVFRT